MPVLQTTSADLGAQLDTLLQINRRQDPASREISQIEAEAKKLSKVDPAEGYTILSVISGLCHDTEQMKNRFNIARNQGVSARQEMNYATILARTGLCSESAAVLAAHADKSDDLAHALHVAAGALQYQLCDNLYEKINRLKLDIDDSDRLIFERVKNIAASARESQVTDKDLALMGDEAGAVMRNHGISRCDFLKFAAFIDDDGRPCACQSLKVPVSYAEASEMNMELAERMVLNGMFEQKPQIVFRFLGSYEHDA